MTKQNKLARNFAYNTLYQVLVLIAPLITTPYISRVLGVTGIGIYSYAQSIAMYFVLLGAVGTTLYGQREIACVQDDPVKRTRVFWQITIFRAITTIGFSVIYYVIFAMRGEYSVIYQILMLEVLATAFDVSWFFMGLENFKLTVIRNSIIKVCGIVLVFVFVKTPEDVPLYTWCLTLPILIGNISLWFNLKKYLVRLKESVFCGMTKHIKPILILFVPQVASEVYLVLDKTMLGLLSSNIDQVGFYTQAQKIVKIVLMLVTSLGTVMLPAMSAAFVKGKKDEIEQSIKKSFQFIFLLAFALFFGLLAVAPRFVPLFFGPGYDEVVPLMVMSAPLLIVIGISNVIGKQFLLPTKQQKSYTLSIVAGAGVNFVLNLILIYFADAIGATIATVMAEIAVTVVQVWCVRKQLPLKECFRPSIRYFFLGMGMFVPVYLLGKVLPQGVLSLGIMIVAGAMFFLVELLISKDPMLDMAVRIIKKKTKNKQ